MLSIWTCFWLCSSFYTHLAPGQAVQAAAGLFLAQQGGCIRVSVRFPGLQFAQLWINNGSFRCKRRVSKLPLGLGLFPSQIDAEISCAGGRSGMLNKLSMVRAPRAACLRPQSLPACFQGVLAGAVAGTSWPMSPDQRSPTSPRPALSQERAACLVPGTGALMDLGGCCAGGLGVVGARGAPAGDPPLRAQPCLVGSRVRLSTFAEKYTGIAAAAARS